MVRESRMYRAARRNSRAVVRREEGALFLLFSLLKKSPEGGGGGGGGGGFSGALVRFEVGDPSSSGSGVPESSVLLGSCESELEPLWE